LYHKKGIVLRTIRLLGACEETPANSE